MMKMDMWMKAVTGVALCGMLASVSMGANITYVGSGTWDDYVDLTGSYGWDTATLTMTNNGARISGGTVTLNSTTSCYGFQCGYNGTEAGTVIVQNGGNLSIGMPPNTKNNMQIGYADSVTGTLTIQNGGVVECGRYLEMAHGANATAILNVDAGGSLTLGAVDSPNARIGSAGVATVNMAGTMNVPGYLALGSSTGAGTFTILEGGVLSVGLAYDPARVFEGSTLDLRETGTASFGGDCVAALTNDAALGRILGNRLANNVNVALVIDPPGVTNTVVSAIPSIPNLSGLSLTETTNLLSDFGYVVGSITTGYESGALTDYVIGQSPAAGSAPLSPGASIDLVIQETSIPNLVGESFTYATNTLAALDLTLGSVSNVYIFDSVPETVLAQNPAAGGLANAGDTVDLTITEPLAAQTSVPLTGSGDWMDSSIWDNGSGVVPERETQGFKVQGKNGQTVTLTNKVAVKTLVLGDGSSCQMDILDGGHLVSGQYGDWTGIGYSAAVTLNIYTGGVFETRGTANYGYRAAEGVSRINVDGGTFTCANWVSLGLTNGTSSTETVIKNGGSFTCLRFRNDMTNGVITIYEGSFAMLGTGRINDIQTALDVGTIVIAPGYTNTLDNSSGDSVLTAWLPGEPSYDTWAGQWGVEIGGEEDDFDDDLANNFYEYALNGDPTNALVTGETPLLVNNGGVFEYMHPLRSDDSNLVYTVETRSDLVNGSWTNIGSTVSGTDVTGGDYNVVTNLISTVDDSSFIRLKVTNP